MNITARSWGVVMDFHPGPSTPDGDEALVLPAPTAAALRFIAATATCCPPSMSASMLAASCPTPVEAPPAAGGWCRAGPAPTPRRRRSTSVWDWLARAKLSGRRLSSTTIASSGLIVLAGACCADGRREAGMRPESRSASSHACAGPWGIRRARTAGYRAGGSGEEARGARERERGCQRSQHLSHGR